MPQVAEQSLQVSLQTRLIEYRVTRPAVSRLPVFVYTAVAALTCIWVLSLPIFPSQDAPLHLYYVHIFSELLAHQHTTYTQLYAIRHWLPPYATYYYGLVALGHLVSLEAADKLFVTGSIALFAVSGYLLLRTTAPRSTWAPFLLLPVLLNWPTFMGFANYMLSIDLACLAIVAWLRATQPHTDARTSRRYCALFLLGILLIVFTHPLPWLFAVGFASLELTIRHRRHLRSRRFKGLPVPRRELLTLLLACLPYLYLARFKAKTQIILERRLDPKTHLWRVFPPPTFFERLYGQYFSLIHMHGIVLFLGPGPARPYRLALNVLLGGAIVLAAWLVRPRRFAAVGLFTLPARQLTRIWFLFGSLLAAAVLFVPDSFAGAYYFTSRLQILVYLCFMAAAAEPLERLPRVARAAAALSVVLALCTLGLGQAYVAPISRVMVSLRQAPLIEPTSKPGLLFRPVGVAFPPHLNFDSYNWAPVNYFRWHELPLYNTSWLGEPLIPLRLTPQGEAELDSTYFNQAPQYGERPMFNMAQAHDLLTHVGFAFVQRDAIKRSQHPFAIQGGSSTPSDYAQGWACKTETSHWYLCRPTPDSTK